MKKKTIFLIVLILGVLFYLFTHTTIDPNGEGLIMIGVSTFKLEGYTESCIDQPVISVSENGVWREVMSYIPSKGRYYVDGNYVQYGMCDVVTCLEIEDSIKVSLIEYKKTGEQYPPESDSYRVKVPVYQSTKLSGKVKVEQDYYSDSNCQTSQKFEKVLEI